jgi:hypothetical protein
VLIILAAAPVALAVAAAAGSPAPLRLAAAEPAQACKAQGAYEVSDPVLLYRQDGRAKLSRLDDLPKADHEKAVLRTIGPCAVPVVVRQGAGQ